MPEPIPPAEHLECLVLKELHAAARPPVGGRMGLRLETIGSALASVVSHEPSILKLGFREACLRENFAPSR